MDCETNVWGLRPGRSARSARHARRVGDWAAALAMVGGVAHPGQRCLVAGASCCERRGAPRQRSQGGSVPNMAFPRRGAPQDNVPKVATAPMQVGRQCGVVVNVGGPLNAAAPSTQRPPRQRSQGGVVANAGSTPDGTPNSIPNNEPAFAPEAMLHRLKACLSSAKSRNPMSPAH